MTATAARASYIVTVYRRGGDPGREVTGIVQSVETSETRPFAGRDELWNVLVASGAAGRPARKITRPDGAK